MKKVKRFKLPLTLLAIWLTLFILAAMFALSYRHRPVSDQDRMEDLSKIESAVNAAIARQGSSSERKMPQTLSDLKLNNLAGKLSDYKYEKAEPTYHGGNYDLCATFENDGEPYSYGTVGGYGAANYKSHHKGETCFHNSVYKGGSHISPL